jgi:phytoene dehydrogenase-like protein
MKDSIIVIGAGIAGLSAGCYGQMNGYRTEIFELHSLPGGLCTSWKRGDYTFDGCIHWLVGSRSGPGMNQVWQELGATQDRQFVDHEVYMRVEGQDDQALDLYTDLNRLEQHMKELAPADAAAIDELCQQARRLARFSQVWPDYTAPPGLLGRVRSLVKMLPFFGALRKYSKVPVRDFTATIQDPFLRRALDAVFYFPDFPMLAGMLILAWMHDRNAGYPIGGSLEFARAIERRYLDLGGTIHYNSRVDKVLVDHGHAVGVRLTDGTEHRAHITISAADGHATIFDMLEGKYADETIRHCYEAWPIFPPIIQVSLGVDRDLTGEPHSLIYLLDQPVTIAGVEQDRLMIRHLCYDATLAPVGKSVIIVPIPADYQYWKALDQDSAGYGGEKEQVIETAVAGIEQRFPGIRDDIEVVNAATPLTYERYTGNWQGSMEGWLMTTETMAKTLAGGMDNALPGLEDFYMVGQWVEPGGGLPSAATSGREVVEMICKRDGKPFVTQVPD